MGTLLRHGSETQKETYLPAIARGELRLQAFGVTEPTSGTDTSSLRTTARLDGDHFVVNGQKIWTSRSEYSDLMILLCRTTPQDKTQKKTDGLSVLLVDMREARDKTLTIRPIRTMMNHATTEIFFDDMRVPAHHLIGEEGKGFRYILSGMNAERILIAAECIGDAKWFIEKATAYAAERSVFGRPIGQNQGVQFPNQIQEAIVSGQAINSRQNQISFEIKLSGQLRMTSFKVFNFRSKRNGLIGGQDSNGRQEAELVEMFNLTLVKKQSLHLLAFH